MSMPVPSSRRMIDGGTTLSWPPPPCPLIQLLLLPLWTPAAASPSQVPTEHLITGASTLDYTLGCAGTRVTVQTVELPFKPSKADFTNWTPIFSASTQESV